MQRSESLWYVGGFCVTAVLGAVLLVSVAEASLPTGGMLLPRPHGPARSDMPASTSVTVYRIPSAVAYGLPANEAADRHDVTDDESVYGVRLPENWNAKPIESYQPCRSGYAGLQGICVVTLCDERRLAKPKKGLYTIYLSQRYEFASPEAKESFDANPARYAPALEGRDVVLSSAAVSNDFGSLRHAGFYREQLYLFQSEDSLREFCRNPQRFAVR